MFAGFLPAFQLCWYFFVNRNENANFVLVSSSQYFWFKLVLSGQPATVCLRCRPVGRVQHLYADPLAITNVKPHEALNLVSAPSEFTSRQQNEPICYVTHIIIGLCL
jgi:hypothetical protein